VNRTDIKHLLKQFYPEKRMDEADDRAMEMHLRLLLERAEDALDREQAGRENRRRV
jgi:hypothetical protein